MLTYIAQLDAKSIVKQSPPNSITLIQSGTGKDTEPGLYILRLPKGVKFDAAVILITSNHRINIPPDDPPSGNFDYAVANYYRDPNDPNNQDLLYVQTVLCHKGAQPDRAAVPFSIAISTT